MDLQFFDSSEAGWSDLEVTLAGRVLGKIRGIRYKVSQDTEPLYAAGDEPIEIKSGNRSYEGEIKVLKGALDDMNLAAMGVGGRDLLDARFDVVATYEAADNRGLRTDTLVGIKVGEMEKGWEQGAKSMDVSLPIKFLRLVSA